MLTVNDSTLSRLTRLHRWNATIKSMKVIFVANAYAPYTVKHYGLQTSNFKYTWIWSNGIHLGLYRQVMYFLFQHIFYKVVEILEFITSPVRKYIIAVIWKQDDHLVTVFWICLILVHVRVKINKTFCLFLKLMWYSEINTTPNQH